MKNSLLTIILSAFLVISCQKENIETDIDRTGKYFLNIEDARSIAKSMDLNDPYEPSLPRTNLRIAREIINESIISDTDFPAYYIFNYMENEGFSIISADLRAIPILAYSNRGNFSDLKDTINAGLAMYLEEYIDYIRSTRDTASVIRRDIALMWGVVGRDGANPSDPCSEPDVICEDHDAPVEPNTTTWGPLVLTLWGQDDGYNDAAPTVGLNNCQALTGCVATAMAQVMRYWEHPARYDWSAMGTGNPDPVPFEIAQLMRDCGDAVDMAWGCTVSSAKTNDARKAFEKDFGYSNSADYGDYLYGDARNNIQNGKPVILRACRERSTILGIYVYDGCHAWISDGVRITDYGSYATYNLHMNWGWQGRGDGWYIVWESENRNYQYRKKMIKNINP